MVTTQQSQPKARAGRQPISPRARDFAYKKMCQKSRDEARAARAVEFTGTVERIKFHSPDNGYAIFEFQDKQNAKHFTCAGNVGKLTDGMQIKISGEWKDHPKYGEQFHVYELAEDVEIESGGMAIYIATSKEIYGIGESKAAKLVAAYGENLEAECKANPEGVAQRIGVKVDTVHQLLKVLTQDAVIRETKFWLAEIGFTQNQIAKLTDAYGWDTRRVLQENPYRIIKTIRGYGFRSTDVLAKKIGIAETNPDRVRAGIMYTIGEEIDKGHTWIEMGKLIRESNKILAMNCLNATDIIRDAIRMMISDPANPSMELKSEKLADGKKLVFRSDIHKYENYILETFREIAGEDNPHEAHFNKVDFSDHPELNDGQQSAVSLAIHNKMLVLSGGAGVGKTYTLRVLADIYESQRKRVAFCALAGKAARRITEQTNRPAKTIHRLLEYSPRDRHFQRNALNKLDTDVVIVDEVSMIDVELFCNLLQAVDFKRTALILVGDHNQLPSIGPGSILRDLIATRILPTMILTKVMRQAGRLKENSLAILTGNVLDTVKEIPEDKINYSAARDWYRIDSKHIPNARNAQCVRDALLDYLAGPIREKLGFDLLRDVQVLTPTRQPGRPLSSHILNIEIQRLVQKIVFDVDVPATAPGDEKKPPQLRRGDRIIQTKNNYDLGDGVFNGTIGYIREVKNSGSAAGLLIDFDDGQQLWVKGENRKSIELAYAVTVHKAQGSEFPCVVTICHRCDQFMTHRNWLYTAVTRAKKCSIVIGDSIGIKRAIDKTDADKRRTWIGVVDSINNDSENIKI